MTDTAAAGDLSREAHAFEQAMKNGRVFFFAGSGISYDSNLPSADHILRITARAALPRATEAEIDAAASLQPELFYESLIRVCGGRGCLGAWKALHTRTQQEFSCEAWPNPAHFVLVEYSHRFGKPIITTNFDTMFEKAAAALNIPYRVHGPADHPPAGSGTLAICKIHGSVEKEGGAFDADGLWTTATEISTINLPWLGFLRACLAENHICFVGYSGRDIDLFPPIRTMLGEDGQSPPAFWIDRFTPGNPATPNARRCRAILVDGRYPRELFEALGLVRPSYPPPPTVPEGSRGDGFDAMFTALGEDLARGIRLHDSVQNILLAIITAHKKDYRASAAIIAAIEPREAAALPREKRTLYHSMVALSSHEVSNYTSYGKAAWRALLSAAGRRNDVIHCLTMLSESHRMLIPSDGYFPRPWLLKAAVPLMVGATLIHFAVVFLIIRALMPGGGLPALPPESRHAVIEHAIRFLALVQKMALDLGAAPGGTPIRLLSRAWMRVRSISETHGYAAGIANAHKFHFRIAPDEGHGLADDIYRMFAQETGAELLRRNEADRLLNRDDYGGAIAAYGDFLSMAQASGNRLNAIKALHGLFTARQRAGHAPIATEQEIRDYDALTRGFEGRLWRSYFRSVRAGIGAAAGT